MEKDQVPNDSEKDVTEGIAKLTVADSTKTVEKKFTLDLNGVAELLKSGQYKNIIVMCGAGISTAAGIPDFRSPKTGIYAQMAKKYNMSSPEQLFSIDAFKANPKPYYERAANLFADEYLPTYAHFFVSYLHKLGVLLRCYTQNIDTLERRAGVPGDKLVEAHGSVHSNHCWNCKAEYTPAWFKEKVLKKKIGYCEKCDTGVVKPDVIFFGEELPDRFFDLMDEDFPKCDLLLVMGSSLKVQPFSGLIALVKPHVPRVLINLEKVGDRVAKVGSFFGQVKGFDFDGAENVRDVALLGDLQQTLKELVKATGWEKDIDEHQAAVMSTLEVSKPKDKQKKDKKDKKEKKDKK